MRTLWGSIYVWWIFTSTSITAQTITRGPYLQLGTQTAASIRWRTDIPTVGRVTYGLSVGNLTGSVSEAVSTTEHEVRITGLTPDSHYFYSVGTTTQVLQQGTDNYFLTAPPVTSKRKIRVVSFGDCGINPNNNQINVRDAFLNFRGNTPTDLWMLIGDNSYDGDDPAFQVNFFEQYQTNLMKNSMLFGVPGNHDYSNNSALGASHNIPYFSIFSFPTNAEAGGVASGTKEWYSFDYGPIHFVMLDGFGTRNVNGMDTRFFADTVNHPQVAWLKQDLATTTQKWKIVYQHFPPYSHGAHNSDNDPDLIAIRQFINPILERYGVDLVMLGHSHNYERSYPLHDQYGPLSDYTSNPDAYRFPDDTGTGQYDGTVNSCPYRSTSEKKKQGTVYVVAGSAGALGYNPFLSPHPAMVSTQRLTGGSFYFEVEDNRLDAKFIQPNPPSAYSISDQFTILKDVGLTQTLTIPAGQSISLTASYISDYQWSSPTNAGFSASTRSIVVTPTAGSTTTYLVRDSKNCVQDAFTVIGSGAMFTLKAGNWNDPSVWSGNRVPTSADAIQLKHIVSIPDHTEVHALTITYDPGTKVQLGTQAKLSLAN
ncbi:metallophosphoesterase [Spirosoma sp. HMF3257]|uniref:Metallophosphoesterase n=1 Tax=Spirosoma telluris TaxID=2183553 RepID=A0A327NFY2_9BACT|nr:metallophosphoesterase [Spirosoma telluris]RAI74172.1 metallophosphoesterase [Spirosoma telluris]